MRRLLAVLRHVEHLLIVEKLEDVVARGRGYDGGRNDLVHGLVVSRVGWIMDEASSRGVYIYRSGQHIVMFRYRDFSYLRIGKSCEYPFAGQYLAGFG